MPSGSAAAKKKGRRRPQRVFARSESQPMTGSVTASNMRAKSSDHDTNPAASPT